jgi:sugar lactone lactonase YvrE
VWWIVRGVLFRSLPSALLSVMLLAAVPVCAASSGSAWHVFAPVRTAPVLYQPSGIALDAAGNLFVSDAAMSDVRKLSPSARPLATWGSNGSGNRSLGRPSGIARAPNGDFYVADPGKAQVVEFAPDGSPVRSWPVPNLSTTTTSTPFGTGGNNVLTLTSQLAIATGPDGTVLTLQPAGKRQFTLRRFSAGGAPQGSETVSVHVKLNTSFPESQGIEYIVTPLGLAVAPDGTQFLTVEDQVCSISRNNRCRAYQILQKRSAAGTWSGEWKVTQTTVGPSQTTGLAFDRSGRLLVPSPQDNRIYTYSAAGARVGGWKPASRGVGDFSDIGGLTVSAQGDVFLVGARDRTVQKLSPDGRRLALWGKKQSDVFSYPNQLAVDRSGNVYVTLTEANHVKKLRPNGTTAASWTDPYGPAGIAVAPSGNIYVGDRSGVREYSPSGKQIRRWGATGRSLGHFSLRGADGIAVSKAGNVYAVDPGNARVDEFNSAGRYIRSWGRGGAGPGQFQNPAGIAISPAGNVYVADAGNSRIQEFLGNGKFLTSYHVPTAPWDGKVAADYPPTVAVDAAGDIFTTYYSDAVVEIVPGGSPRFFGGRGVAPGQFQNAAGVALDRSGTLYVSDVSPVDVRHSRIERLKSP